jgi:peptide/nickel transport system ATP-binding protein
MYLGVIVEVSPSDELYDNPLHPYTISLLSAIPIPDPEVERARKPILLAGDLPSPANPPAACRFHTRCPYVQDTLCRDEAPPLRELAPGHVVACHWAEQIRSGELEPKQRLAEIVQPVGVPTPAQPSAA